MSKLKKYILGILFWIISLTWGALLTIPSLVITGILILCGYRVHKNGFSYIVEVGGNWGGLEIGAVAICGNYSESCPTWFEHTRRHEFGHNLQQLVFGPLMLFIVGIPSACRYWYKRIKESHGTYFSPEWYDSAWFESEATRLGTKYVNLIEK